MIKLFWNTLKIAPVLFAASLVAASGASAQSISADKEAVNETLQQINNYQSLDQNDSLSQVTNVNQLRDVSPTDWAYEALRSLVDRYGCISGFPNQTYRGNQPLSRYEFAAGLNSCLNQIERLIASQGSVGQEDLDTINRLSQEFESELATLGGRVDEIESRTADLEDGQFSTTTKLKGEAIFGIADVSGGGIDDDNDDDDIDTSTTFSSRVRLNLDTSFYGKDRLRTRLQGGNFINLDSDITGTDSTRLGFDSGGDFDIAVTDLHYRFPFGGEFGGFTGYVGALGLDLDDIFDVANPALASSGGGALSRFSRRNPLLFRGTEGAGAGVQFDIFSGKIGVNAGYLTDTDDSSTDAAGNVVAGGAPDPNGDGLFNGSNSTGVQLTFSPFDLVDANVTYVRTFTRGGADFSNSTVGGLDAAGNTTGFASNPFGDGTDTTADRFGGGVNINLTEKVVLAGFGGYADVEGLVDGDDNNLEGEVITWGANISLVDFFKEGSQLSVAAGLLPKFTSDDAVAEGVVPGPGQIDEDRDDSYLIEALYKFPVNDNITITPGGYVVLNPNHDEGNEDIYVGVLRTTFKF